MRTIGLMGALFLGAWMVATANGCGGGDALPMCSSSNSCQQGDPVCTQPCGAGRARTCQCGQDALRGTLVCGECTRVGGTGGAGGRVNITRGSGGTTGSGGRPGRGSGGAGIGGRTGRGSGGANSASGGVTGTGGFVPSDAGTPTCAAGVEAGGVTCTATATPICQTACVAGMYNICTCISGSFVCPGNQIACP